MAKIKMFISTNKDAPGDYIIPIEPIEDFLGELYSTGEHDGEVVLQCMPRAVNPEDVEIWIQCFEILKSVGAIAGVIKQLIILKNKMKKHNFRISIKQSTNDSTLDISLDLPNNADYDVVMNSISDMLDKHRNN